ASLADAEGRLEVFALDVIGTDPGGCCIWWTEQNPNRIVQMQVKVTPPGSKTPIIITVNETAPPLTPWSDWILLPGGLVTLRATRNADGRLILFGANSGRHLYRKEQNVARALQPSDWTSWVPMDDGVTKTLGAFSATRDKRGAVNLFAHDQGGQIFHARQSPPCSPTWAGWSTPGLIREGVQALAAGADGHGDIVLAATDLNKFHSTNHQRSADFQQWTGWIAFNLTSDPSQLALDYNSDGRLSLFSHWLMRTTPPYGGLWVASQMKLDSTEWELGWTLLAESDIRQFAVVRDLTPPT